MLLTITTTEQPATDLGYLLHKNPYRSQSSPLAFGKAHIFYPEATEEKCTVALLLDIDSVELVRGKRGSTIQLDTYVNDRPYVCSSFMSVALNRLFGQSLKGICREKPELATREINLCCTITTLPCRGGEDFLRNLFEPLGYNVTTKRHLLDSHFPEWGESSYYDVTLSHITTVQKLLTHLYVLIPVLDHQKHYYIGDEEVEKLLRFGESWLPDHPEKEQITKRYLRYRPSLTRQALARLEESEPDVEECVGEESCVDKEKKLTLNQDRLQKVVEKLKEVGASSILDLGCGEGRLLRLLLKEKSFRKIVGLDVSIRALEYASEKLHLATSVSRQKRVELLHGSLTYRDERLSGFDAAAVVEVIEHLDEARLESFERVLFEYAKPSTIVLTTPNREYNVVWENVGSEKLRHGDHRFEWTRKEFEEWSGRVAQTYGYRAVFDTIGDVDEKYGAPTQMCTFIKGEDK
jgi:3' terminal RNA ribose 2'-O-methyltransferase Hen1